MRNNFITKLFLFISIMFVNLIQSQEEYPKYYVDDNNNTFVIFTVEQAKQIDKDYQILNILKDMNVVYEDSNNINIKIVNDLNEKVYQLELKCSKLEQINMDNENIISELKSNIADYEKMIENSKKIVEQKDKEVNIYKKDAKKQKFLKVVFIVTTGILGVISIAK